MCEHLEVGMGDGLNMKIISVAITIINNNIHATIQTFMVRFFIIVIIIF